MMSLHVIQISVIFFISLIVSGMTASAQDVTFEASVNRTRMSYEDTLVYSLSLSGGNIDLKVTPQLPDLHDQFDILRGPSRSTSISIVNGRQSSSLKLQYLLSPKKTGTLEIGPARLEYDKNTYMTDPVTIEVVQGSAAQAPSPSGQPQQQAEKAAKLFVRAEVDKKEAYIGEQITVSYSLYTRIDIAQYGITRQPGFTGFWKEEIVKQPEQLAFQEQDVNGVPYAVALIQKVALFPTQSGEVSIDPMIVGFLIRVRGQSRDPFDQFFNDPFFGQTQEIIRKTQPIPLNILPLPEENQPPTFSGDVGTFHLSVEADPQQVTAGEPVTLKITIQGAGNITTVKEPVIELPETFKRYDTHITENAYTMQEPVQGEKLFETVLIPSDSGDYEIPPVHYTYFDPQRKAYQHIRSEPIPVTVLPGAEQDEPMERRIATKEEIRLLGKDIRFIKTSLSLSDQGQHWYQSPWFVVVHLLPIPGLLLAYGYIRYRERYMSDETYVRRKRAAKASRQRLKKAGPLMEHGETKAFYAEISGILRQYLGDKLNLPPAGIHGAEISNILQDSGLDEDTASLLRQSLEECDFARFAPGASGKEEMKTMLGNAETILERVEGLKTLKAGRPTQKTQAALWLLVTFSALWMPQSAKAAEPSIEHVFQQGNRFYEQGHYTQAIACYQEIVNSGFENGYVYYNLGNALLKHERIGEAILHYERAVRLRPRDEDVAFNLDYARAFTLDKMKPDTGKLLALLQALRDYWTPHEVSIMFTVFYLLFVCFLTLWLCFSSQRKPVLLSLSIVPLFLLLCSGSLLALQLAHTTNEEAIILSPEVEAKNGPGEAYSTVFEVHEGAKVRIQREKQEWVEIRLPNNMIGWVNRRVLERILTT